MDEVARLTGVALPDGTTADVVMLASSQPAPAERVFAALMFVCDSAGDFALVYSPRRREWSAPAGWREGDESVVEIAIRELAEETGLVVTAGQLEPIAYQQYSRPPDAATRGAGHPGRDVMQCYLVRLGTRRPAMTASLDDTTDRCWATAAQFQALCQDQFWWPFAQWAIGYAAVPATS